MARACYRPIRAGMCRLPAGHTFPTTMRRISPYENRSSGYRSHADIRDSAPSPQNLTGKPFLTCTVGPFMVELFAATGFADGRRGGQPRFRLSPGRKLPTPAALNEPAEGKPEPHGQDSHPLCVPKLYALQRRCGPSGRTSPTRPHPNGTRSVRIAPLLVCDNPQDNSRNCQGCRRPWRIG